jgi:hypothetical protein
MQELVQKAHPNGMEGPPTARRDPRVLIG